MRKTRVTNLRFIHFRLGVFLENLAYSLLCRLWHKAWGVRPVKRATSYGRRPYHNPDIMPDTLLASPQSFADATLQAVRRAHFAPLLLGLALGFGGEGLCHTKIAILRQSGNI